MPNTDLAIPAGNALDAKLRYANGLAAANLLPAQYRNQPANVLLAVELGEALGIPTIQAINGIHVIEGKPSASADLIAALVRRAGHKLRVTVNDAEGWAVAQIIRGDDPDFTYEARWDMEKATAAGLAGKGTWRQYPGQMMRSRAITEVARMAASDALYGVVYTPEELGADMSPEGNVVVSQVAPEATTAGKPPSIQAAVASAQMFEPPTEPADDPITKPQLTKLAILVKENGMQRAEGLGYYHSLIGREVASSKDLTKAEASTIIDALETAGEAGADPQTGEVVDAEIVDPDPRDGPSTADALTLDGLPADSEHAADLRAQAAASWGDQ